MIPMPSDSSPRGKAHRISTNGSDDGNFREQIEVMLGSPTPRVVPLVVSKK